MLKSLGGLAAVWTVFRQKPGPEYFRRVQVAKVQCGDIAPPVLGCCSQEGILWEMKQVCVPYLFSSGKGEWVFSEKCHLQSGFIVLTQPWKGRDDYIFEQLICASHCFGSSQLPSNPGSSGIIPSLLFWERCMKKLKFTEVRQLVTCHSY